MTLNRSDLIALINEFAPAKELENRVEILLQEKANRSASWCRDSAEAIADEKHRSEATGGPKESKV